MYQSGGLNHGNEPLQHLIRRELLSLSCGELLAGTAQDINEGRRLTVMKNAKRLKHLYHLKIAFLITYINYWKHELQ